MADVSIVFYPGVATASRGGAKSHVAGMTTALRELGCEVHIINALRQRQFGPLTKAMSAVEEGILAPVRVLAAVRRLHPDVLYTRIGVSNVCLAFCAPIARRWGVAVVGELNGAPLAEFEIGDKRSKRAVQAMRWFLGRQFRACDAIRTVSAGLAELARAAGASNVQHIPNGSDLVGCVPGPDEQRHSNKLTAGSAGILTVGFAGVDAPWYELDLWEEAARRDVSVRLLIATDERSEEGIRQRSGDLIQSNQLTLRGWLSEPEMAQMLQGCDVVALPLRKLDPPDLRSPLKLYTYLRLRVPIVATIADGVPLSLQSVGVVFYESGDIHDLMETLADVRENLDTIREAVASRCPGDYSWSQRATSLCEQVLIPAVERQA